MLEWTAILTLIDKAFYILVGVIGWLIRRSLQQQEKTLEAIYQQVHATNGRVGRLEEWKANHEDKVTMVHESLRESIRALWERVNHLFDNGRK